MVHGASGYIAWQLVARNPTITVLFHVIGLLITLAGTILFLWAIAVTASEVYHYYQSKNLAVAGWWAFLSVLSGSYVFIFFRLALAFFKNLRSKSTVTFEVYKTIEDI